LRELGLSPCKEIELIQQQWLTLLQRNVVVSDVAVVAVVAVVAAVVAVAVAATTTRSGCQ
jgi:hypothetical protein